MDRGLWVTWYNLPEKGREDYLAWLHGEYIPAQLKRPGYLWAAHYASVEEAKVPRRTTGKKITTTDPEVPKGDRFILIFGAEDSNVFGNPLIGKSRGVARKGREGGLRTSRARTLGRGGRVSTVRAKNIARA